MYDAGVRVFSDSRVKTGRRIRDFFVERNIRDAKVCLLRPPQPQEFEAAISVFDRFYVSTFEQMEELDLAAEKHSKLPEIILMVETGDRREGFLPEEVPQVIEKAAKLKNIRIKGFGTNTTCLNRSKPSKEQILKIVELTEAYIGKEGIPSPGNSGALYLLRKKELPAFDGELRIGEAILLGNDTITYKKMDFLSDKAFRIEAAVIESRRKHYDKIQLVVGLGFADIGSGKVYPELSGVKEIRRSSDHMVLLVDQESESEILKKIYNNSGLISFKPDYFALLQAFISPFVEKLYI